MTYPGYGQLFEGTRIPLKFINQAPQLEVINYQENTYYLIGLICENPTSVIWIKSNFINGGFQKPVVELKKTALLMGADKCYITLNQQKSALAEIPVPPLDVIANTKTVCRLSFRVLPGST